MRDMHVSVHKCLLENFPRKQKVGKKDKHLYVIYVFHEHVPSDAWVPHTRPFYQVKLFLNSSISTGHVFMSIIRWVHP